MYWRGIISWVLLWGWGSLLGQSVSVHNQHASYSGKSVQVSITQNPFLPDAPYRETVLCSEEGEFSHTFDLEKGRMIQLEAGVYRANLYVEPGFHYELELPRYQEKSYAERISPYYQPVDIPTRVLHRRSLSTDVEWKGDHGINHRIARFDSIFSGANERVILNRRLGVSSQVDSMIRSIELVFSEDSSPFFRDHRKYRYGVLKLNQGTTDPAILSNSYLGPRINESHPGFMELFRALFNNFLYYYSGHPEGRDIGNLINHSHSLDSIRGAIGMHPGIWCDTLADMVLIKELSEIFYDGNYHKEAILMLLDSMAMNPVSSDLAIYAAQVRRMLASLVIGNPPPRFTLKDLQGNAWSPGKGEGKYIYLMFCTPELYGCMMEYPFLQSYWDKHAAYLEPVTVMVANDQEAVIDFMQKNNYDWKALFYEENYRILSDYKIRAFPTAFLIGPDGNLILSPAPLPSDGFEQHLFRIMRSRGEV